MADQVLRCAVYTRKSTDDGLEQEFNSLDAQYEACAAYATSQRHEGWVLLPERYDDGGFSGGNLERPGLKRLLADVAAGKVDIILLYKIDRFTRSLSDFARIVDVLDKAEASFVSITQSFNTTTSMGRLTLNMLLSFAQFEREVTGERIRDKIAASKRRGMWMGGPVPLGYDVRERRLVVNEVEAEQVRHIMRRYIALGSVVALVDDLAAQGLTTKRQERASGPHRGGCMFRRGTLYHLLANPINRGKIVHKGAVYDGEHDAIVPDELWNDVQRHVASRTSGSARRSKAKQPSLLVGLLTDGEGRAMTPSHGTKGRVRYRYYVTRPDRLDGTSAWRVSAHDLENVICEQIADLLMDRQRVAALFELDAPADIIQSAIQRADLAAAGLRSGTAQIRAEWLAQLRPDITLSELEVAILVQPDRLTALLSDSPDNTARPEPILLTSPIARVRKGHQLRLIIPASEVRPDTRDEKLVTLVAEAHAARQSLMGNPDQSIAAIAKRDGRCRTRFGQLVALSCLAPDIVTALVEGRQPPSLTARDLLAIELPLAWSRQRALLGFS